MKIIGLKVEKYVGEACNQEDDDTFTYSPEVAERHILFGRNTAGKKVKLTLMVYECPCPSGYTVSRMGDILVEEVAEFEDFTHIPKKELIIPDLVPSDCFGNIENEVFIYSEDGVDECYPSGYYSISMDLFRCINASATNKQDDILA